MHSLQVLSSNNAYANWNEKDHESSFHFLQKIVDVWKKTKKADQYLVYGKHDLDTDLFHWEIVPYQKSSSLIGCFWQQFLVLWNITFGAPKAPLTYPNKELFEGPYTPPPLKPELSPKDAFCNQQVINKQSVFEGKEVRVLYNYAPIGFGGERLHFLVVPKKHRTEFKDLTKSEYLESMQLTNKLIHYFSKNAYLFHKTGKDAGQTVPHWHMHVIFTSNKAQDFFGKITVLRNMLFGSFPMKDRDLQEKVDSLKLRLA